MFHVSNTLLNLSHEELRQFWGQKAVQPGTSKMYLIKWLVSVFFYEIVYSQFLSENCFTTIFFSVAFA